MTIQLTQELELSSKILLSSEQKEDGTARRRKVLKLLSKLEKNTIKNNTHNPNNFMKMNLPGKEMEVEIEIEEIEEIEIEEDIKAASKNMLKMTMKMIKQFHRANLTS